MEIGGDTRYYLMDVPANADNQTPLRLVLALHGFDMNNIAVVDLFNFTQRSGGTAITVWPQGEGPHPGTESHWGDGVLESTWNANDNNYAFLEEIIRDLGERYCIDTERVFITGFSMGGFFTNQIACAHSDWFRAFAPVAGGGPQSCSDASVQSAIMVQHGTEDPIVDISSGEGSRDFWVSQNGCGQSSMTSLNNCDFYEGCAEDSPVAWCTGSYDHYIPDEVASNVWSFFDSF
jgi:poly(3-hydroxybutyrate) depolymerase